MIFEYMAKDKQGHTVKAEMEARDKAHALEMIRAKGLLILKLEKSKKKAGSSFSLDFFKGGRISLDELVIFARQLATMTGAGITIVSSLDILSEQADTPSFKKTLTEIRDGVNTGASLSDAMGKHSNIFSSLFVNMVKAGESSGTLDVVLDRVAQYLEKTNALQKKVQSAMVYPSVVVFMAISITMVLIIKVIPVFKDIYSGFGAALPGPTQFMIDLSDLMKKYTLLMLAGMAGVFFLFKYLASTPKGKMAIDKAKLNLPVVGPLIRKVSISKFTRTLSTLVKSGVPILGALEIVAKTADNLVVEKAVNNVRDSVREGENIATPLEKSGIFPPMVVRMVAVGEKSGELERMLSKISDFFDEQVDAAVSGLTSLIEPLIIAFLGIVIGGVVICMFLPIFKISSIVNF
ncbi:MAG: type II secretion system F family protein [Candidatus Omnitrophica bacterium]|nr:type II secretion system F family protein [Candidatus Omnitrophota bacterium]